MRKFTKEERLISEDLKSNGHPEMMSETDVARAIGLSRPDQARAFMEGCPVYLIGKRRKYMRSDVIRQIALSRQ